MHLHLTDNSLCAAARRNADGFYRYAACWVWGQFNSLGRTVRLVQFTILS